MAVYDEVRLKRCCFKVEPTRALSVAQVVNVKKVGVGVGAAGKPNALGGDLEKTTIHQFNDTTTKAVGRHS